LGDMFQTVLVFGLPGVGKTTLISNVLDCAHDCVRLSGGSLIQGELSEEDRDDLRKLSKGEVLSNQELLVFNFKKKKEKLAYKHILFDGHCVIKNGDQLVEISVEVMRRLEPDMIIFLDEDSETIVERRKNDNNRPDREQETLADINKNRGLQLSICKKYVEELNIPLKIIVSSSVEEFIFAAKI